MTTKLKSISPEFQAQVHKEVLHAKLKGLYVHIEVSYDNPDNDFSYVIYTKTPEDVENYYNSGGTWRYVTAKEFLDNSSSFAY